MKKALYDYNEIEPEMGLSWLWQNQPPVMKWWFVLSGISIASVYFVLLSQL